MVECPKEKFDFGENLIGFISEYQGKHYFNIRKTYTDRQTNQQAMGKGLCTEIKDWGDFKATLDDYVEYIDEQIALLPKAKTEDFTNGPGY